MRVLIVQIAPTYVFVDDFKLGFEKAGHQADVVYRNDLGALGERVLAFRPEVIFSVGVFAPLSAAFQGALPVVYFALDKLTGAALFHEFRPNARDVVLAAYKNDRETCTRVYGFKHVEYLPFCANIRRHSFATRAYKHDVSFVGAIVRTEGNDYTWLLKEVREIAQANPALAATFEDIVRLFEDILAEQEAAFPENRFVLEDAVERRLDARIEQQLRVFKLDKRLALGILAKEAAHRQREFWLRTVPGLTVYGPRDWSGVLPSAHYMGPINQFAGSSEVFYQSKININIQRIYALDGLSDRVFNVLYSNGFLLADRNDAILELFDDKRELVTYGSVDEMADLIRYYLAHDSEREAIAQRGYERVMREHLFEHRVEKIMQAVSRLA